MILRSWILFLLSLMFVSAIGIGIEPTSFPFSSAYVLMFLAAVAGIVATSLPTSAMSTAGGHTRARAHEKKDLASQKP